MKKGLVIGMVIWLLAITDVIGQQLPAQKTFRNAGMIWNPALTAPYEYMQFGVLYRQEWISFEGGQRFGSASFEYPFIEQNMSAGVFVFRDEVGVWATNAAGLNYAYHIFPGIFSNDQLSFGISGKLFQQFFDATDVLTDQPQDDLILNDRFSVLSYNVGFGMLYSSNGIVQYDEDRFFLALGTNQTIPGKTPFSENTQASFDRVIEGNMVVGYRKGGQFSFLEPSLLLNFSYPRIFHAALRLLYEREDSFWGGLEYHSDNTIFLSAGLLFTDGLFQDGQFRVGVTGGYNISTMGRHQGPSFECVAMYLFELD